MKCKRLKIRSKNYKKYFYCTLNKCIVEATVCYCCKEKEYKQYKALVATNKSRRSQACAIEESVKEKVWERDLHRCIFCGLSVPVQCANAHFIPRSAGRFRN